MSSIAVREAVIIPQWAHLTANALVIDGNPIVEELEGFAAALNTIDDRSNWWKGDVLLYAEKMHGKVVDEHGDVIDMSSQVIPEGREGVWTKARWVCERFHPTRRRNTLTYSHHEILVKFDDDIQEMWLNRAEDEQMSVSDLRKAIKGENGDERVSWAEKYEYLADVVRRVAKNLPDGGDKNDLLDALKHGN